MPITVDVPELGAEVEFPDGMSHDDIASAITKHITGFKDLSKDQPLTLRPPRVQGPSTTAGGPPLATPDIGQVMAQTGELAEQGYEIASKPTLPDLPLGPSESFIGGLAKGGVKATYGIPQFLSSPIGATTAAVGAAAPLASTIGFSGVGLEGVRESLKNISGNWDKMTSGERGESISGLLASMAMFGLPAKAAVNMIRGKVPGVAASRILDEAIKDYKPRETPAVPPAPVREQGVPTAAPEGMVGLKDLTPQSEAAAVAAPPGMVGEPTTKLSPQAEAAIQELVPAIKTMSGEVVAGEKGQSHNDIIEQNKIPAKEVDRREFVDTATGQEVSREKLATAIPTKKEGEAHSSDLSKAQEQTYETTQKEPTIEGSIRARGVSETGRRTVEQGIGAAIPESGQVQEASGVGTEDVQAQRHGQAGVIEPGKLSSAADGIKPSPEQSLLKTLADSGIPVFRSVDDIPNADQLRYHGTLAENVPKVISEGLTAGMSHNYGSFKGAGGIGDVTFAFKADPTYSKLGVVSAADTPHGKPIAVIINDKPAGISRPKIDYALRKASAPPTPAPVKAEPSGRDWDAFTEELIGELDSFSPARHTGRENYELNDVADRFAQFAKADTSGKPLDKLVADFAKTDEASPSQIRKLRQGVKSLLAQEKLAEPSAPPPPAQPKGETPPTPPPVEQKGVGPATGEGPGATVAGPTGIDPKAQIEQLADSFRNIEGQKLTIGEKLKQAFQVGERLSGAKDALSKALDGLKSTGNYLIGKWNQVQNIDDLLRAKGDLSAALETRGWRVRQWEKLARKATPSLRDQAAIAKYVDAGGDMAELQRGFTEAPPKYKQAYRDAMNLKGDLKIAAENIRNYFDSRLQEAIDAGVLEHGVEDYIHRIYESKPKVAKQLYAYVQTGLLQKNPALTKKRIFQFDWEAEKLGYKPVQSYIPRIAQYESSLARAIAAREFIKKATTMRAADGRPVIDIKGVGIPIEDPSGVREATLIKPQFNPANKNQPGTSNYRGDYVNKEFPALSRWKWVAQDSNGKPIFVQGDVAIHPDYVNRVAALLEPSRVRYGRYGAVARPALAVGSAVKQTMLDLSGFHQVQTTVHGLEHRINPLNLVQEIDFNNPDVDGLLKGGVTLGGDYRMQAEGLAGQALTRHIPFLGPALESYHQWLFQDYIPRLKMTMALHALERNKSRYSGVKSPEEIYHQTASEANAAFGEQNYIMLERSKTAQDMARLILLAPDFLEARGRFAGQALTKGGKAFGNEQRTALLLGALTMYVTARILNKATTGQYHNEPENLFSVVHNGKAYGLRTVQGDILHLIEHPLQFWMHRLNPVFGRTTLEMATGRDEFGRKRSMPEQLWDFASTVMPISLRTSRERSIWESLANSFGINARRWQDTDDAFKLAKDWKAKHGIGERGEFIYDRDKDPLRPLKLALTSQDEGAAVKEIKKLIQSKTYTIPKLNDYFRRYASMPFTGSRANDVAWKRTLSEDQLKTVDAAKQHKESIRQLYMKALAKVYAE